MAHYLLIDANEVIEIIYNALRKVEDSRVNDVTRDNDHKSSEIILTTDDGKKKQCWVISSTDLVETEVAE